MQNVLINKMKSYIAKLFKHTNGKTYNSHVVYSVRMLNYNMNYYDTLFICSTINKAFELIKKHIIDDPVKWIHNQDVYFVEVCEYYIDIANINNISTFYTLRIESDEITAICKNEYKLLIPKYFQSLIENTPVN